MVEVTQEDREAAALNAEVARLKHDLEVTGAQYQRLAALGDRHD